MALNSFYFILLFPVFCVVYFILPAKFRQALLVIVSYLIYMSYKPIFSVVLLGITLITYEAALLIQRKQAEKPVSKMRLMPLFGTLILLPLLIFKYTNFINENITDLLSFLHLHITLPGLNWAIPVGISFYSFQAYAYFYDVYKKKIPAEKNLLTFTLFLSFFPQTLCGPISRANSLIPQLKNLKNLNPQNIPQGMRLWLWGVFMKVCVADQSGLVVDTIYKSYQVMGGVIA